MLTLASWVLVVIFSAIIYLVTRNSDKARNLAPGPRKYPIIGNIPFIAKFPDATAAFTAAAEQYGDIVSLKMGTLDSVLISGYEKIHQVLIKQADSFDARPNFERIKLLFHGDKNNSLAFADYSELHNKRRQLLTNHCFPRPSTSPFDIFNSMCSEHVNNFVNDLHTNLIANDYQPLKIKYELSAMIAHLFFEYFCSVNIQKDDPEFIKFVRNFEIIFAEINAECIGDVFPALMPFINKSHLTVATSQIREFVVNHCIKPREEKLAKLKAAVDENNNRIENSEEEEIPEDLLATFMSAIGASEEMTLDVVLYALEDIVGGHTAVANSYMRMLVFVSEHPEVQQKIREEVGSANSYLTIDDKLPYTEATVWEAVRHIGSPIVPHVATEDAHIDDYFIGKGTVLFINNFDLNFSPAHWEEPEAFKPERFLPGGGNFVRRPKHFFPFSTGRRSCMGYKLSMFTMTLLLGKMCANFQISQIPSETYKMPRGCIAVRQEGFEFNFKPLD